MRNAHDWGRAFARPRRSAPVSRTTSTNTSRTTSTSTIGTFARPALLALASGALWAGCSDSNSSTAPAQDSVRIAESTLSVQGGVTYPLVAIQPSQVSLQVGGQAALKAKLTGPAQNTWDGRYMSWTSSDPTVASVAMSGWGVNDVGTVTGHKNGTTTITATTLSKTSGTITVTVGTGATTTPAAGSGGQHEPAGMQAQINTGAIRSPGVFSMFSPSSPNSTGEWNSNLTVVPGATGLRVTYRTNLTGGYSPARFGTNIRSPGSGWYYQRMKIRFSSNWTLNGNVGLKFFEPRTYQQGSVSGPNENHVISMSDFLTQSRHAFLNGFLQGPYNQSRNLFEQPLYNPQADLNDGQWHTIEVLFTPESSPGAGNGSYTGWVDGTQIARYTNVKFLAPGNRAGWPYLMFDPTYGGGTHSPPTTMYWDFDDVYVSTK